MAVPDKIGLIAGSGNLPIHFARLAKREGFFLATAAIKGAASPSLNSLSNSIQWLSVGQIGALLTFFKGQGVRKVVLHGKVAHASLFRGLRLDFKALSLWASLEDRSGEGLLKGLAGELEKNGIKVMDGRFLMADLLAPKGFLTRRKPGKEDEKSARYGIRQAKGSAKMGLGQTVLVKANAVVAIEAMEGTDQAVLRAGKLAGPGVILAKASSPHQDWRFDIPTVGPATVKSLARSKGRGMVLEAGKVFILDLEKTIAAAEKTGLFILAV